MEGRRGAVWKVEEGSMEGRRGAVWKVEEGQYGW